MAGTSTALLTDRYELTMLEAAHPRGTAHRRAVFEVFARRLPEGRRYGVVTGTGRLQPGTVTRHRVPNCHPPHCRCLEGEHCIPTIYEEG